MSRPHRTVLKTSDSSDPRAVVAELRSRVSDLRPRWSEPPPVDSSAAGPEADPESVARRILLDQLSIRARSRAELETTLRRRGVPDDVSQQLLDRFEQVGLVDDHAFAQAWVESRQRGKGLAPRALAHELRRKGVADDVVRQTVADIDRESQYEAARRLVERRLRAVAGLDPTAAQRRLLGLLARKGYSPSLSLAVVRDVLHHSGAAASDIDCD